MILRLAEVNDAGLRLVDADTFLYDEDSDRWYYRVVQVVEIVSCSRDWAEREARNLCDAGEALDPEDVDGITEALGPALPMHPAHAHA